MSDKRLPVTLLASGLAALIGIGIYAWRSSPDEARSSGVVDAAPAAESARPERQRTDLAQLAEHETELAVIDASPREAPATTLRALAWGGCADCIGKPDEDEGAGETPLRLAAGADGSVLLLDKENDRLVRLGPDGKKGDDVRLPFKPEDVAVGADGAIYLLDTDEGAAGVTILDPDGTSRTKIDIPEELASGSRRVLVSGKDVYVESNQGEYTRIGDTSGARDPDAGIAAGMPTRDGSGWLSVRLVETEPAGVHVLVVERPSEEQRFSRLLQPTLSVEGIFMADTSADGTIYVGIIGEMPGDPPETLSTQLLCLDGRTGHVLGVESLSVRSGEESILDAKALDGGGVVFSVYSPSGVRVERHDCQ